MKKKVKLAEVAVASVLGEAPALLEAAVKVPGPDTLFDLVALRLNLQRLKPRDTRDAHLAAIDDVLHHTHAGRLRTCHEVFSPEGWLRASRDLFLGYQDAEKEDPFTAESEQRARARVDVARELLRQIDDAGLVLAYAVARRAVFPAGWVEGIRRCQSRVADEPELFFEAGDWAGVLREGFRSYGEIQKESRELARTVTLLELVANVFEFRCANPDFPVPLSGPSERKAGLESKATAGTGRRTPVRLTLVMADRDRLSEMKRELCAKPEARLAAKAPRKPSDYGKWARQKTGKATKNAGKRFFFIEYASEKCPWVVILRFKAGQAPAAPVNIEVRPAKPGAGPGPDALRWGKGLKVPVRGGEATITYAQLRKCLASLGKVTVIWNK
jgi:hypothetical protein